jgi:hypothetical protein
MDAVGHDTPSPAACRRWARDPQRQLSVKEFFVGVAKLGGHLARKHDGPPGRITLWRGWRKLHLMITGAGAAIQGKCG